MRSVSTPVRRLLAIAGATALAVTLLAAPANAEPALTPVAGPSVDLGPAGDPLQTIAAAYRTTYPDLTPDQARAAAVAQTAGEDIKAEITARWDTFGGGWFDPYTATYHLAVTAGATAAAVAQVGQDHGVAVETPLVDRSLDELESQADELRAGTSAIGQAAGGQVGIDVTTNQVVAAVPAHRVASLAGASPPGVTLVADRNLEVEPDVCTSRTNCDDNLRAGLRLRRSGVLWCSLGFTARGTTGIRWTLTAGHCHGTNNEPWSNGTGANERPIGPLASVNAIDSGDVDVAAIQTTNAFYSADSTGRIYIGPGAGSVPVNGDSFLLVNDIACLSANIVDPDGPNHCGTVTSTSDPQVRGMVRISGLDGCGGESGGGWYWLTPNSNRFAVALHSRSESGCRAAPHNSWASPLTAFFSALTYETG